MKKLLSTAVFILMLAGVVWGAQLVIDTVGTYDTPQKMMQAIDDNFDELYAKGTPVTSEAELTAAISGSDAAIITGTVTLTDDRNLTIPVYVAPGGSIDLDGNTFTISADFNAGKYEIFADTAGGGDITYSEALIQDIRLIWYPTSAMCAAAAGRGATVWIDGQVDIDTKGKLDFDIAVWIRGTGWDKVGGTIYGSELTSTSDDYVIEFSPVSVLQGARVSDLVINHTDDDHASIYFTNMVHSTVENTVIANDYRGIEYGADAYFAYARDNIITGFADIGIYVNSSANGSEYVFTNNHVSTTEAAAAAAIKTERRGTHVIGGEYSCDSTTGIAVWFYNAPFSTSQRVFVESSPTAFEISGTSSTNFINIYDPRINGTTDSAIKFGAYAEDCAVYNPVFQAITSGNIIEWADSSSTKRNGVYAASNYLLSSYSVDVGAGAVYSFVKCTTPRATMSGLLSAADLRVYNLSGTGYETANAETPTNSYWTIGDIVEFVDSGDASGDGFYLKTGASAWDTVGEVVDEAFTEALTNGGTTTAMSQDAIHDELAFRAITPEMYGATGNGVADDLAEIEAALAAVPAGGVLLMNQDYGVSGEIDITNKTDITITGTGTIRFLAAAAVDDNMFNLVGTIDNLTISDLTLIGEGNATAADFQVAIGAASGQTISNTYFERLKISDFNVGISINANNSGSWTKAHVTDCYIKDILGENSGQGYGIHIATGAFEAAAQAGNADFVGNKIENCSRHSYYIAHTKNVTILGGEIVDHRKDVYDGSILSALQIARSENVVVSGLRIIDSYGGAVMITSGFGEDSDYATKSVSISNCVISNFPEHGIYIGGSTAASHVPSMVDISGNQFVIPAAASQRAIVFYQGTGVTIDNNMVGDPGVTYADNIIGMGFLGTNAADDTNTSDVVLSNNKIFIDASSNSRAFHFGTEYATGTSTITLRNNLTPYADVDYNFQSAQTNPNITILKPSGPIYIKEQADADSDKAGYGQIWINTATPNELWWTDDAGTDTQLVAADGSVPFTGNPILPTESPAAADACTAGEITWDASYIYICTASGAWKRATLTGGY